jgi:[ribosomal protein S5]-alanine N-acetyltransferase
MRIEFKRLSDVDKSDVMELMNHPLIRRHMPLAKELFDDAAYDAFIKAKEQLWQQYGYGPWAFFIDGIFVEWGGLQFEEGDADLALVLHPRHWGMGKVIYDQIIDRAFGSMGFQSITALLSPSRIRLKGLKRLRFKRDGETELHGEKFLRFRLYAKDVSPSI